MIEAHLGGYGGHRDENGAQERVWLGEAVRSGWEEARGAGGVGYASNWAMVVRLR